MAQEVEEAGEEGEEEAGAREKHEYECLLWQMIGSDSLDILQFGCHT